VRQLVSSFGKAIWRSRPVQLFLGGLLAFYLRLIKATTPFAIEPAGVLAEIENNQPVIIAMWHGQHFMAPLVMTPRMRFATLISRHGDGEINAIAARMFGIKPIRGSGGQTAEQVARRGGSGALRAMIATIESGASLCFTADVPKVARVAGKGIVTLARHTGRPIIPMAAVTRRRFSFRSWDRASIGMPFTRGALVLGEPIAVDRRAGPTEIEAARLAVEAGLDAVHRRAYAIVDAIDPGADHADIREARQAARAAGETP
jgi:lysophospholipid acyltransferase (LPLAT)-like uncharacterized protein